MSHPLKPEILLGWDVEPRRKVKIKLKAFNLATDYVWLITFLPSPWGANGIGGRRGTALSNATSPQTQRPKVWGY